MNSKEGSIKLTNAVVAYFKLQSRYFSREIRETLKITRRDTVMPS
jgi:hypothetical protein